MKKFLFFTSLLLSGAAAPAATTNISAWTPLFKGVDVCYARVFGSGSEHTEALSCLRINLTDPDVRLLTTPKCTNNCAPYEVLAENTSHFLEQYGTQVAINGSFYASSTGPNDVPVGTPEQVLGLAISRGELVSPADEYDHSTTLFFTSNNIPTLVPHNWPPIDSSGFYTAITGNYLLLSDGVNVGVDAFDYDPRTAIGISQDRNFLYLMTVDGRQGISWGVNPPWSDGLNFYETADWLARFGASDGINIDGGGSTTMCMQDCNGSSQRLNRSSYVYQVGRERFVGHNFGVYAKPYVGESSNLSILPGTTTAIINWDTTVPSDTQVVFGNTNSYGLIVYANATPLESRLVRKHTATINGLTPGGKYYLQTRSSHDGVLSTLSCSFSTTTSVARTLLLDMTTSPWKYTTNNLDLTNWKRLGDDDSAWFGPSNGCFHIENSVSGGVTFAPRNTLLPPGYVVPIFRTYYFKTPFVYTGSTAGLSLTLSNYIDDGAAFYLNGGEIGRIRLSAGANYSTFALGGPCGGTPFANDAASICPDVFTVSGNAVATNLLQGDNMLAVEVHNVSGGTTSQDIFFGSTLFANTPANSMPKLFITVENGMSTLSWNGSGFVLQRSTNLSSPANWTDVPGPVTQSSYTVPGDPTMFYRLRN